MSNLHSEIEKFLTFPLISEQIGAKSRFGRLILHDERNKDFPLRALSKKLAPKPTIKQRTERKWRARWQGDQGNTSMCTAYSFLHFFEHEPINHPRSFGKYKGKPYPIVNPRELYCEAQQLDPWPGGCGTKDKGDDYEGTSVLAMMKVAQGRGFISEYAWEYSNLENVIKTLLEIGPVMVGTNWYSGMELNQSDGNSRNAILVPEGRLVGGHAYLLDEINLTKARKGTEIGIFNSWGPNWGWNGRAFISLDNFEKLMREDGEVCLATELP